MDSKFVEQQKNRLEIFLTTHGFTEKDFDDVVSGWAASNTPLIGQALANHAADFLKESGAEMPYGTVTAEAYCRTFFDAATASRYPHEAKPCADRKAVVAMVDYLIRSLQMDMFTNAPSDPMDRTRH